LKVCGGQGFTLIEVLIAIAIIGVGLITLLTLFPIGLRSSRLAGDFTTATFIGQQALDNIRASAQVYDPADAFFINTYDDKTGAGTDQYSANRNGLGYYELPVSAVKGYLSPLRFPVEPTRSQAWTIEMTSDHDPSGTAGTYSVNSSVWGLQTRTGTIGLVYTSDETKPNQVSFVLYDNRDGADAAPDGWGAVFNEGAFPFDSSDIDYDEFAEGDQVVINIEMRGGVPYYWYAMRAPVTEDQDLDGILDGRLPDGTARSAPHNQFNEDTGLDLVPDFWDTNNDGAYQKGLDRDGEFSDNTGMIAYPGDPHGDNHYAYDTGTGWWNTAAGAINPNGAEGNGTIDARSDHDIQKVSVTIGWREGGTDRMTTFSAAIPNQYR
jgi:prepilin-type N-terminal cleavage/methylation domain-containing protein